MKKWGILIGGLILGFIFGAKAQTDMSALFSSDNENIIYAGQAKDYTGSPLVFIEGISDKPQPKDWKDELKIKLFGSMEIPKGEIQKPLPPLQAKDLQQGIKINPLFGAEKEVLFVPHTTDWSFIIQVLNDEEIVIQEEIQFIKTADIPSPIRSWPKQDLHLLDVKVNGLDIPLSITETGNVLSLNIPELEAGVRKIHLAYLIKNAGVFSEKSAQLKLPLTDMGWNLPTDSFNGVILFPNPVQKAVATFLLGKNRQEINGAFDVAQDAMGALFFRATHLMPAHSALQINLNLEYDSFIKISLWDKMMSSTSFVIFIVALMVIFLYLILNIIEIKITPFMKTKISNNSFKNFFYRTGEIWIGLSLLWIGTAWVSHFMNSPLSAFEIQVLILIPIVFVLMIDYLLLYPRQRKIRGIE